MSSPLIPTNANGATAIPSFISLHPPSPDEHHPPPTGKLGRMRLNAIQERTPEQNRLVAIKMRVLSGIFVGLCVALPLIALAFQPRTPSGTTSRPSPTPSLAAHHQPTL